MIKYPAVRHSSQSTSWEKREVRRKWHNVIGIFVTITLLFAIANGIAKSFSLGKYFGRPSWDSNSPFSAVINTKPISVFIYNPNSKKISLIKLDENLYTETGDNQRPLAKIAEQTEGISDGKKLASFVSGVARVPVNNYFIFSESREANDESMRTFFKGFASFLTPFNLVLFGPGNVKETNITRNDLIKLWWQTKSLSIKDLNLVDSSDNSQEIVLSGGQKILGVDDVSMHMLFSKYIENEKVLEEGVEIEVLNASGFANAGQLAADFVTGFGGRVGTVHQTDDIVDETFVGISGDRGYTVSYLAKIFDCDIKAVPSLARGEIKITVGRDFGRKY